MFVFRNEVEYVFTYGQRRPPAEWAGNFLSENMKND